MLGDPKKMATLILGIGKSKEPDEDEDVDALEVAAEELLAAIDAKDASGIASALRSAVEICAATQSDSDDE